MLTRRRPSDRPSDRRGFTLTELMVALSLLAMVLGGLLTVVTRQQRFTFGASEILETQRSVREAADLLPSDLRALSPSLGDIYEMTSSAIAYRAPAGASVVCTIDVSRRSLTLPPSALASQSALTSWVTTPQAGDSLLVYDRGTLPGTSDDRWQVHKLAAAPIAGTCPTTSGFTANTTEAAQGWTLAVVDPLQPNIGPGSAIRFFRRARYNLYQSGDGSWYLGHSDCLPGRSPVCSTVQPVSGPYLAPEAGEAGGISFAYFDAAGAVTTDSSLVARIDVVTRAKSRSVIRAAGFKEEPYRDSLAISINVRN